MTLRRAMCIAASMIAVATVEPAFAQAAQQQSSVWGDPAPQQPAKGADSPWGPPPSAAAPAAASPWDQPQQPPPCVAEFVKLRDAAEQRAIAIRKASARKASPKEACGLFGALSTAQLKMIKYAKEHQKDCGIPVQIIDQISQSQHQVSDIRTKVCEAANRPARSAAPTLSDALTTPVPNSNNIKTGRGTFDTLTGSPLGER